MGRVEVRRGGQWGTVSDHNFGLSEANIACRAAGFGTALAVQSGSHYGRGIGRVHYHNLRYVSSTVAENAHKQLRNCLHLVLWKQLSSSMLKYPQGMVDA